MNIVNEFEKRYVFDVLSSINHIDKNIFKKINFSDIIMKNTISILPAKFKRKEVKINELSLPVYYISEEDVEGEPILFFNDNKPAAVYSSEQDMIILTFDIFASAFYLLTLEYEKEIRKDKIGRVIGKEVSIKDDLKKPLVNYYAKLLKSFDEFLKTKNFKWISENKLHVILTHDIDYISSWRLFILARSFELLKKLHPVYSIKNLKNLFYKKNPYKEGIKILNEIEKKYYASSIYFFLMDSGNFFEVVFKMKGTVFSEKLEVLFQFLIDSDNEIGLHTSFQSYDNSEMMIDEKEKLERIINMKIFSNRQHYLNLLYPQSWISLEEAGIEIDYTLTYHDISLFRAGIAAPFHPIIKNEIGKISVVPLQFMDRTFSKYNKIKNIDELSIIREMISHVKFTGGVFTMLWHNNNISRGGFENAESKYMTILEMLKNEGAHFIKSDEIKDNYNLQY